MKLVTLIAMLLIGIHYSTAQTYKHYYQDGLVVFQLKEDVRTIPSTKNQVDFKQFALFSKFLAEYDIQEVRHLHPDVTSDKKLVRTYQIRINDFPKVEQLARKLNEHESIEYAELKVMHYKTFSPNDPRYSVSQQWGLFKILAAQAWDLGMGSANVIVGVTDDSFQLTHPDLQSVFLTGRDMHQDNNNPVPCGTNDGAHGTHVSGIVGAETNNGVGVAAIGGGVKILPVKIGDCTDQYLPYGYEGVVWAADNGAHIINMSWGAPGGGNISYGQNVMNYASSKGCILIAASGNDNVESVFYPANYSNVTAVASTDQNDGKSSFSNYGTWIDISAPGTAILSTIPNNTYASFNGTSMASPMVAGLVGLMKSFAPSATNAQIIDCLYSSADAMPANSFYNSGKMGHGRINAYEALLCLSAYNNDLDMSIEVIEPIGTVCGSTFTPKLELRNLGSNTVTSATIVYNFGGSNTTYNWTGNLSSGSNTTITLPTQTMADGNYTFTATVSNPNGQPDENPSNNTSSEAFIVSANGKTVTLVFNTDCWGDETTWDIKNSSGTVIYSGGPYELVGGGTQNQYTFCLAEGCYSFTVYDEYGDGMSGSQYQACNVNGYYELTDDDNNTYFVMEEANGDFGYSKTHPFCIESDEEVEDDAGIINIVEPIGLHCEPTVAPVVELRNYGTNTLTSVTIEYRTTAGGAWSSYNWTGSLATAQTTEVTLPAIAIAAGQSTITARTSSPNGNADGNTNNDQAQRQILVISDQAASLPFVEDFENNATGWLLSNPDGGISWNLVTTGGNTPGNVSAFMDFFGYNSAGQRDGLISPKIDLTGMESAEMTFDHAYRRFDQNTNDSLIIYVSTDCGSTFQRVVGWAENGTGNFATQTTTQTAFTPQNPNDWCLEPISQQTPGASCFTVSLDAFVGHEVMVMFESYKGTASGNNLYIDNINITGEEAEEQGDAPEPNFTVNTNEICEGDAISFTDASTNEPTSWNWTFPGGTPATSTAQNPTVTYNTAGVYNVTLEVTNEYGSETQTFTNEITVTATPNVSLTASSIEICAGESVELTASGASSYTWDNGLASGATHSVTPSVTTTYTVTGANGSCEDEASITVTVKPEVTVAITASSLEICEGESVTLEASGASSYNWSDGLGWGATKTVTPTSTTTYVVTGTSNGCTDIQAVTITVLSAPEVVLTASSMEICAGESVDLTASGASSFTWDNGLASGATHTVTPSVTTTYTVTGANGGCVDVANITVTVNPAVNLSLTASSISICEGESVNLEVLGADSYQWDNGLGASNTHTVSPVTTTTYTVVGQNENCSATASITIEVTPQPVVTISASATEICVGTGVTLTAAGADAYTWDNGLGGEASHTVYPTETTTYEVVGQNGACSDVASITIEVIGSLEIELTASATTICLAENESVTLTVSGANSYSWDNGLGEGDTQVVSPTETTTYTVVGDNGECTATASITVVVNAGPTLDITASSLEVCKGESVMLVVSGGNEYVWSPGSTLDVTVGNSVIATPTSTTTYSVMSANECGSSTETIEITVNPLPTPEIIQSGDTLSVDLASGETAVWYFNGTEIGTGASIVMIEEGVYKVEVSNANDCIGVDSGKYTPTSSIDEVDLASYLQVYPNPASSSVNILWNGTQAIDALELYDAQGRLVLTPTVSDGALSVISIERLQTGVYVLRVTVDGHTIVKRITKR